MPRHEVQFIVGSNGSALMPSVAGSHVLRVEPTNAAGEFKFGVGQVVGDLAAKGLTPSDVALDLLLLAVAVQIADTRIERSLHAQDSWSREIDITVSVAEPDLWQQGTRLIERMLRFLSGDLWSLRFVKRAAGSITGKPPKFLALVEIDEVRLFSGGMDSYLGAVEALAAARRPMFVSHYWDLGTSSQAKCASLLGAEFGDIAPRHLRVHVGADKNDFVGTSEVEHESTQRARSFLFFALAAVAASGLGKPVPIVVPENGLISLNVPLDAHRLGAYSTRTTHPFYMGRWNELLRHLSIPTQVENPYRFLTKGEMILRSPNLEFVRRTVGETISCSSVAKARWEGHAPAHCGYCYPCIIRRAAERKGLGAEVTNYHQLKDLNTTVARGAAKGEHLWSLRYMAERLERRPKDAVALVHKTGSLGDLTPAEQIAAADVFHRGIAEVDTATTGITFS